MAVIAEQLSETNCSMVMSVGGNVIALRQIQLFKAYLLMVLSDGGSVRDVREE